MDKLVGSVSNLVGDLIGLKDPVVEQGLEKNDRVAIEGSPGMVFIEQSSVRTAEVGKILPEILPSAIDHAGEIKEQGERFFMVATYDWSTTDTNLNPLRIQSGVSMNVDLDVAQSLLRAEFSSQGLTKYHTQARFGLDVIVVVNTNQFQQGCLMVVACPGSYAAASIGGYCCLPHGFINCAFNNVVRLRLPWISTKGMYDLKNVSNAAHNPPPWLLRIVVTDPLKVSGSTAATADLTVFARFVDLDLHGLNPLAQVQTVNISANFNVVNMCNGVGTDPMLNMGLGCDSWICDVSTSAGTKLTSLRSWTEIPGLCAQLSWSSSSGPAAILARFPVTPFVQCIKLSQDPEHVPGAVETNIQCTTPLASIMSKFAYWRGDVVFHFHFIPTKYHSGRVLISYFPGSPPSAISSSASAEFMAKATSALCCVHDLSGTESTCVFRVPWVNNTPWCINQAVQQSSTPYNWETGTVTIMILNRLVCPSSVHPSIKINVYVSGRNMQGMAPIFCNPKLFDPATGNVSNAGDEQTDKPEGVVGLESGGFDSGGIVKSISNMPAPPSYGSKVDGIPVGAVTSMEDPGLEKKVPQTFPEYALGKPLHSSDHMEISTFMGRSFFYDTVQFTTSGQVFSLPIQFCTTQSITKAPFGMWRWFFSLFHLYRGPLCCTLTMEGTGDVDCTVSFIPEGMAHPTDNTMTNITLYPTEYANSVGQVHWNTLRTDSVQLKLPWYNPNHAISGNLPITCDDIYFGRLVFAVRNLGNSEVTRVNVFLSLTDESEVSFMRPPSSGSYNSGMAPPSAVDEQVLHPVTLDDALNLMQMEEESRAAAMRSILLAKRKKQHDDEVDGTDESKQDRLPVTVWSDGSEVSNKPYKPLRMVLGRYRLQYAREELRKARSEEKLFAQSGVFEDGEVLEYEDDGWTLRGVYCKGEVFYVDCSPRMCANFNTMCSGFTAKVDVTKWTWKTTGTFTDVEKAREWSTRYRTIYFDWGRFQSGDIRGALHNENLSEKLVQLFRSMVAKQRGPMSRAVDDTKAAEKLRNASEHVTRLADECRVFIKDIRAAVADFQTSLKRRQRTVVFKMVMSIAKACVLLFVCSRSGWKVSVVLGVMTILALDIGGLVLSVEGILENMFDDIAKNVGVRAQSLDLRSIAAGVGVFKNMLDIFKWLYTVVKRWYDENYGKKRELMDFLDSQKSTIDVLVTQCDALCNRDVLPNEKAEFKNELESHLRQVHTLQSMLIGHEELKPLGLLLRDARIRLVKRLESLGTLRDEVVTRPEPIVVYLSGEKGSGKSLTAMALAVKICKALGVNHQENIYTKPVGATYWDGYCCQLVCMIDDIGQKSDDEDWSSFCQLVSTAPMRLDMAHLNDKGQHFTSPVIICTSNVETPHPKTVYTPEAILRRLHYQVKVSPKRECSKSFGSGVLLDVKAAKDMGLIQNMECVDLVLHGDSVTIDYLVQCVVRDLTQRDQDMEDFVTLWSQGDGPDWTPLNVTGQPSGSLEQVWSCVDNHLVWTVGCILGTIGVILAAAGVAWYYQSKESKLNSDNVTETVYTDRAYHGTAKPRAVIKLDQEVVSQSILETSNLVHGNLVRFGIELDNTVHWVVNGLGIKGNWLILPAHSYEYDFTSDDDPTFYIQRNMTFYSFKKSSAVIMNLTEGFCDLVLVYVPGIPLFRDITMHFVKEADLDEVNGKMATLATFNGNVFQLISEGAISLEGNSQYMHRSKQGVDTSIQIGRSWRGAGNALPGSCGGGLISSSTKTQNAIVGIHVAAGGGVMISSLVTREMLSVVDHEAIRSQRVLSVRFVSPPCNLDCRTSYRKTPIGEWVPCDKSPSAKAYVDDRPEMDPLSHALHKFSTPVVQEPVDYSQIVDYVVERLHRIIGYAGHKFLSNQQAIVGYGGLEGMELCTSPGLPYVQMGLKKRDMITSEGAITSKLLLERLDMLENRLDQGLDPCIVYQTSLKDELRSSEKVRQGKTRMIECCPVEFTIAVRKRLGYVVGLLHEHLGFGTGIAVGINPDGDWHAVMKCAMAFGDMAVDCDFSGFDSTVSPFMIKRAVEVLCFLSGLDEKTTVAIVNSFVYTRRRIGGVELSVVGGVPSGCPCTSILDSLINLMNCFYALRVVFGCNISQIDHYVRILVYGDDVMMVLKRGVHMDCQKFTDVMESLGMVVTSANKKGRPTICPLSSIEFLKRNWRFDEQGMVHPLLDEQSILGMLKWARCTAEFRDNVRNACEFWYHYGREVYMEKTLWLKDLLLMARFEVSIPTYEELHRRFWMTPHYRYVDIVV